MKQLTAQQMKFCERYVETSNATQSYIDAGYKVKNADVAKATASRLLTSVNVSLYVKQLQDKELHRTRVSKERVIDELVNVAFGSISEIVEIDEEGRPRLKPEADLRQVDAISSSRSVSDSGYSESFTVKRGDRLKALEMLCKLLGLYDREDTESRRNIEANAGRVLEALRGIRK
jgi:phage terminase small subunit